MKTKTEEKRQTETLRLKTELCLNMKEIWLNNAGVVSVGHGIEPPGVSHRPIGPSARLAARPGGETATRGRTQSVPFSATSCCINAPALAFP